jgi:hypothetical protein
LNFRLAVAALALATLASCSPATRSAARHVSPSPLPIATGDYPMFGYAADFSWIAGKVQRDLSCLYLNFGDSRRSLWGGRIALNASADQMDMLRNGDTIVIKGELTRLAYGSCGSPSYLVSSIEEH